MGVDWMNQKELGESIPPAYTEFIGKELIKSALKDRANSAYNNRQGDNALDLFDKTEVESGTAPVRQRD